MSEKVVYVGKDLEAMSFAVNYHRWIYDEISAYLGKNIIEVGAGVGSFSEMLLESDPDTLSLVEPSELYGRLARAFSGNGRRTRISTYKSVFTEVADQIVASNIPDSIIYINVLEHIDDDRHELRLIHKSLKKGGNCVLFVPALKFLYGNFDRAIGHYRRYGKSELERKCTEAGFQILQSTYFDFAGVLPWFVKYRLLGSEAMGGGAVELYDRLVVPVFRRIEAVVPVPIGKNILLIAEK